MWVRLAALLAAVGFLSGVRALVWDQVWVAVEALAALWAGVGSLSGVDALVDLQVEACSEGLSTLRAARAPLRRWWVRTQGDLLRSVRFLHGVLCVQIRPSVLVSLAWFQRRRVQTLAFGVDGIFLRNGWIPQSAGLDFTPACRSKYREQSVRRAAPYMFACTFFIFECW